jgi:hypothetical protein
LLVEAVAETTWAAAVALEGSLKDLSQSLKLVHIQLLLVTVVLVLVQELMDLEEITDKTLLLLVAQLQLLHLAAEAVRLIMIMLSTQLVA